MYDFLRDDLGRNVPTFELALFEFLVIAYLEALND